MYCNKCNNYTKSEGFISKDKLMHISKQIQQIGHYAASYFWCIRSEKLIGRNIIFIIISLTRSNVEILIFLISYNQQFAVLPQKMA